MIGDGHDFHFGYLYGGGSGYMHICIPESRYYEIVDYLANILGLSPTESDPFFINRFAQFGAVSISATITLPAKCGYRQRIPTAAQIKRHALRICTDTLDGKKGTLHSLVLDSCKSIDSFYGAVRCYGIAAAGWKMPIKSGILLSQSELPDSAIVREDVYDFFRSIGYDEHKAYRQMKRLYKGLDTTYVGTTQEQKSFLDRCAWYSYMPSRICAVEYYVAKAKLSLNAHT